MNNGAGKGNGRGAQSCVSVAHGKAAMSMPLSTLLGVGDNDGSHQVRPWPQYVAGPNLGWRSARGKMELGEEHSGVKHGVPYTIRRVR